MPLRPSLSDAAHPAWLAGGRLLLVCSSVTGPNVNRLLRNEPQSHWHGGSRATHLQRREYSRPGPPAVTPRAGARARGAVLSDVLDRPGPLTLRRPCPASTVTRHTSPESANSAKAAAEAVQGTSISDLAHLGVVFHTGRAAGGPGAAGQDEASHDCACCIRLRVGLRIGSPGHPSPGGV